VPGAPPLKSAGSRTGIAVHGEQAVYPNGHLLAWRLAGVSQLLPADRWLDPLIVSAASRLIAWGTHDPETFEGSATGPVLGPRPVVAGR